MRRYFLAVIICIAMAPLTQGVEYISRGEGGGSNTPEKADKAEKADRPDRGGKVDKSDGVSWADRDRGSSIDRPAVEKPSVEKPATDRSSWADRDRGSTIDRPSEKNVDKPATDKTSWADRDRGTDIDVRTPGVPDHGVTSNPDKPLAVTPADAPSWADRDKPAPTVSTVANPTPSVVDAKRADEIKIQAASKNVECYEKAMQILDATNEALTADPEEPVDIVEYLEPILDYYDMCPRCEQERALEEDLLSEELIHQNDPNHIDFCKWLPWRK